MNKLFMLPLFALAIIVAFAPELANAQTISLGAVDGVLCAFVDAFTSSIAVGIATLAVIFLAIGAFFGKVNWQVALTVIIAIVVIFAAAGIVASIADAADPNATAGTYGCS